jgi:hypothetical protein
VAVPHVEEPILFFSMVQAASTAAANPTQVIMPEKAMVLSSHVGKMSKGRLAGRREIGKIAHPGATVKTVDLFNAVQRAGGAARVRLPYLEQAC